MGGGPYRDVFLVQDERLREELVGDGFQVAVAGSLHASTSEQLSKNILPENAAYPQASLQQN